MKLLFLSFQVFVNLVGTSLFISATGQNIKPVGVGGAVPNLKIKNILNYSRQELSLSELKGKLVLIDFWGTTCSSCIEALPKIDSLQKQFKEKVQVLTVTEFDSKDQVHATLRRISKKREIQLPVVLNGSSLKKLFPHEMVSHVVWIDQQGVVRAITGTAYITAANIEKVLAGVTVNWPVKDDISGFDYQKPFLAFNKENAGVIRPDLFYYSSLTGHLKGVDGTNRILIDSVRKTATINSFNHSLLQLAGMFVGDLYRTNYFVGPKRIIFNNVNDKSRYLPDNENPYQWELNNTYCHSISVPLHYTERRKQQLVKEDIRKWFLVMGINIKIEERSVTCLKLIQSAVKTAPRDSSYIGELGYEQLRNCNSKDLTSYLNYVAKDIPWINDSTRNYTAPKVDIILNTTAINNINTLRKELQLYGFDVVEDRVVMEMYIIEEY